MKMVMISYNEAMEDEVMEALGKANADSYTKFVGAFGKGIISGTHMGDDIWPGKNNVLFIACEDSKVDELISGIKVLRSKLGNEGVKAFIMPIEKIT